MLTIAPKLRICRYALAVLIINLLAVDRVTAQSLEELTSSNPFDPPNAYEGNTVTGNTITRMQKVKNTSALTFVIDSISAVQSLDPEDLGFPDGTPSNGTEINIAMLARFPGADFLTQTGWLSLDPPRKTWTTEVVFSNNLPLTVGPGEVFQYTRISTNNTLGPNFGPKFASTVTFAEANSLGEVVIAIDLNWHIIPEPTGAALSFVGLLCMLRTRRKPMGGKRRKRCLLAADEHR